MAQQIVVKHGQQYEEWKKAPGGGAQCSCVFISDIAPTVAWKHGMLSRTSFWKENRMGLDVNKQFQNMEVAFVRTSIMAQHSLH